jgi:hypothetical protein
MRRHDVDLSLGQLYLYAANQHLYDKNFEEASRLIVEFPIVENAFIAMTLDLAEFCDEEELIQHLWMLASKRTEYCSKLFLTRDLEAYYASK